MWTHTHTHNLALEEKVFGNGGYHKGPPLVIGFDQVHSCFSKAQGNRTGETSPILPQELKPLGRLLGLVMLVGSVICE